MHLTLFDSKGLSAARWRASRRRRLRGAGGDEPSLKRAARSSAAKKPKPAKRRLSPKGRARIVAATKRR
jgi:hypothetical protein